MGILVMPLAMKNATPWIVLAIVLVLAGLGYSWYQSSAPATPSDVQGAAAPGQNEEQFAQDPKDGVSIATVIYTDDGFVPSSVSVPVGGTVTFLDQSTAHEMWIGSDEHPTHTQYDGTNKDNHCPNNGTAFDQCGAGATYSFTFTKAGTWGYHNHKEDDHRASVIVR